MAPAAVGPWTPAEKEQIPAGKKQMENGNYLDKIVIESSLRRSWMPTGEVYDHIFKILVIGDSFVGKTALITVFSTGRAAPYRDYQTTIGIDFKIKTVELNGKKIKLQIWDTAGQERFHTITTSYYRGAMGIMLVYDITQEKTFDNIAKWLRNIQEHANEDVEKMLLGNKCDMEDKRMINKDRGETIAKENGIKFLETSAKANINVEQAFMTLAADILKKYPQRDTGSPGVVKPDMEKGGSSGSKCCP